MTKPKLVFTDSVDGVRAYCPKCRAFELRPTQYHGAPFVQCSACKFESPASLFEVRHEKAHGDRVLPPLTNIGSNGKAQPQNLNLLKIMSATHWLNEAAQTPPQCPMFDAFFFERELCLLFGSANTGKSVLTVQIADALSKGSRLQGTGVIFEMPKEPRKVLVCDFEMNAKQFEARYSDNGTNHFQFSPNLLRAEFDATAELPKGCTFEQVVLQSIENAVKEHRIDVVCVDNLSALCANAVEMKDAVSLMRELKRIKETHNLTMLVVSHTPKIPPSQPLTKFHVAGSMMLVNLCDSVFCVGESTQAPDVKYLKMIKSRASEFRYDSENVIVCRIGKHSPNFLSFDFTGYDSERAHLKQFSSAELNEIEMNIIALHENEPTLSQRQIADRLNVSQAKVCRVLRKVAESKPLESKEPF
jgi:KaiC/GvpD/RAD55 family RecA-like ATPase